MSTPPTSPAPKAFAFGPFVLIPAFQTLLKDGAPVRLGCRAIEMLAVLVGSPGELVTKRELLATVWPGLVVEEGNVKVHMAALRRVLGDAPVAARYIATVTGRGYRFVARVKAGDSEALHPSSPQLAHGPADAARAGQPMAPLLMAARSVATFRQGIWSIDLASPQAARPLPSSITAASGLPQRTLRDWGIPPLD